MVELPAPVMVDGVKLMELELPCPEADKVIAELKPPVTAVLIVTEPDLLLAMLMLVGDALIEKPGVVPVTVSETVVFSIVEPEVPDTVML